MEGLFLILLLPAAFAFYCAWKADDVYMPYKVFDVFGKFKARMFVNFIWVAIVGVFGIIYCLLSKKSFDSLETGFFVLMVPLGVAISILIYKSSKGKCPDGPLKDNLAKNMYIAGSGYSMRQMLFFMSFAAKTLGPTRAVDNKGREIYIFSDGDVYDASGNFVGKKTDVDKYVRIKD